MFKFKDQKLKLRVNENKEEMRWEIMLIVNGWGCEELDISFITYKSDNGKREAIDKAWYHFKYHVKKAIHEINNELPLSSFKYKWIRNGLKVKGNFWWNQ